MRLAMLLWALVACSGGATTAPADPVRAASPAPSTTSASAAGCPARPPADRSSCTQYLAKCSYPDEPRCPFARCADVASQLVWLTSFDHCPIECPPSKPAAGGPCSPVTSRACEYKGGDKCGFRVRCTAGGWVEEEVTLCDGM